QPDIALPVGQQPYSPQENIYTFHRPDRAHKKNLVWYAFRPVLRKPEYCAIHTVGNNPELRHFASISFDRLANGFTDGDMADALACCPNGFPTDAGVAIHPDFPRVLFRDDHRNPIMPPQVRSHYPVGIGAMRMDEIERKVLLKAGNQLLDRGV